MSDHSELEERPSSNVVIVRSVEDLVELARSPDHSTALVEIVGPTELQELDAIRQLRQIVMDTAAERATYRSGT